MKKIIVLLGLTSSLVLLKCAFHKRNKHKVHKLKKDDIAIIDGGTRRIDTKAPKQINSKLIISFSVEMSTFADIDLKEYSGNVYNLNAVLRNGAVIANYKCRSRYGNVFSKSFRQSVSFMRSLYQIVSEYDFAKYNGESCFVDGLPDNYGASVEIMFDSGERIYSSDNQSNFIPNDAVIKLVDLFESKAMAISEWTEMEFSRNSSDFNSCFCVNVKRDDVSNMFAEGFLVSNGKEYSFDERFCMSSEAVDALTHMKLSFLPKDKNFSDYLYTDDISKPKLILSYSGKEVYKEIDDNIFDSIFNIFLTEFIKQHEKFNTL